MTLSKDTRVLLTGGAGFIGTHVISRLKDETKVRIFDNLTRNALSQTDLSENKSIEFVQGDVRDASAVESAMEGVTHVIHLASIAGVDSVMRNPVDTMEIAMLGTYNLLRASLKRKDKIQRFIDFSTSEVFGVYAYKVAEANVTSLGAVGEARWTYAVSKLATEHLAHNYFKQHGLSTCSLRPFNIFGPNQVGEGAIHHFVKKAIRNEDLIVHNDGDQIRSWCYIDDIVDGIVLCLAGDHEKVSGQSFNIGNPRNTVTIYHLAKEIIRLSGSSSKITFRSWPYPDVELRIPDIHKAREVLGYEPKMDLETGLLRTIDWYRAHHS